MHPCSIDRRAATRRTCMLYINCPYDLIYVQNIFVFTRCKKRASIDQSQGGFQLELLCQNDYKAGTLLAIYTQDSLENLVRSMVSNIKTFTVMFEILTLSLL